MYKMILDVDTGIDDALALTYACANENIDLIGVCTTYGNVTIETATKNTLNLLSLLGRTDINVYPGANAPIGKEEYIIKSKKHSVHGSNGIGDVIISASLKKAEEMKASEYMIKMANELGNELHLVCVGPLNNLLEAIKLDKQAISKIGSITLMAGALTVRGNVNKFVEANIFADPIAAKEVFDSGIRLNVIPLDVTWKTLIREQDIILWNSLTNEKGKAITDMAAYYYSNEFKEKDGGGAMHDPLAVEASVNPDIITNWFNCNLTVETEPDSFGRLISNKELLNRQEKTIRIALDVDSDLFIKKLTTSIYNFIK